jgi:hypothetical protein
MIKVDIKKVKRQIFEDEWSILLYFFLHFSSSLKVQMPFKKFNILYWSKSKGGKT